MEKIDLSSGVEAKRIYASYKNSTTEIEDATTKSVSLLYVTVVDKNGRARYTPADTLICTMDGTVLARSNDVQIRHLNGEPTYDIVYKVGDVSMQLFDYSDMMLCSQSLSTIIARAVAENPELCGEIPADVYHAFPVLPDQILTYYQAKVLEDNAKMPAKEDRTAFVEEVSKNLDEMHEVFENAEKSKPDNLLAGLSFERKK